MQAKEFLSRHRIAYLALDVDNDPAAARELAALGYLTVPVVVLPGKPPISGFNTRALGDAIGAQTQAPRKAGAEAVESLDRVLGAVLAATAQLKNADLDLRMPRRDRDLRGLIHDVFHKALTWAPESGRPAPRGAAQQRAEAARYRDVMSLRRYGEVSQEALRERFRAGRMDDDRIVTTADGPMPFAEAVAWIADHSAHHLRQIYWLMEHSLGLEPRDPLDVTTLPGITLHEPLW